MKIRKYMRRLFIIRKDLNLKPGKLAAMVSHCAEAFWTNLLKSAYKRAETQRWLCFDESTVRFPVEIDRTTWDDYVNGIFTKTVCEAKSLSYLKMKVAIALSELHDKKGLELREGEDYGYINDRCLTDLTPENPDGTTTVGVWFRPLPDEVAHVISKKFKLYGAFD